MQEDKEKRRNIFSRQFSLSMLMLVVTGIGCYLGGRMQGFRQGVAIWDAAPLTVMTYSLGDLLPLSKGSDELAATLDSFTSRMKSEVLPGVWSDSGGKAAARPFATNSSVVVCGNELVHEAVSEYLRRARDEHSRQAREQTQAANR